MKKFTIPCEFGEQKHPFAIYVGEPRRDRHPLQNQAHWLSSRRGGKIPEAVMESFQKLHNIATENNVSFEELCVYAFDAADKEKKEAEKTGKAEQTDEKPEEMPKDTSENQAESPPAPQTARKEETPRQTWSERYGKDCTPVIVGSTVREQFQFFYGFCDYLFPATDSDNDDAKLLLFAVAGYLFADPNKPAILPELFMTLSSDDVEYSLAVVLDTIGRKLNPLVYMLIASSLSLDKAAINGMKNKIINRLLHFAMLDGDEKEPTYRRWQHDLQLFCFGPDEVAPLIPDAEPASSDWFARIRDVAHKMIANGFPSHGQRILALIHYPFLAIELLMTATYELIHMGKADPKLAELLKEDLKILRSGCKQHGIIIKI